MQVITTIEELKVKIAECNDALTHQSDDAMRKLFNGFRLDLSAQLPADPFSQEYHDYQLALYEHVTGHRYNLENERTLFNVPAFRQRPFPYYLGSTATAGHHLQAIGFLLRSLDLPSGSRIVEFGPGWGNTTIALALLGMKVTAVDVEPNFCQVLRERAVQDRVELDVVEADFFWAESVTEPYDAAVFFECFHHCDDHLRLLRALRTAVKPGGIVVIASEPIIADYPISWGLRTDGEALWAMRNFGWLELGFRQSYFEAALARTGWTADKRSCADPSWASVWIARRCEPDERAHEAATGPSLPTPIPASPGLASLQPDAGPSASELALAEELRSVYRSTSWRLTAPLRAVRRWIAPG